MYYLKKTCCPHTLTVNFICLFYVVFPGTNKDEVCSADGSDNKPKQLKFPNQVYIDLPLWKDEQGESQGPAGGGENQEDPTTSTSSTSTTPQHTPTNSLKRTTTRRRTDAVFFGFASILASVAFGFDLREVCKGAPNEEPELREEKKKREGLFQRATRFRRSTSPPGGRSRKDEVSPGPVNLLAMSSISECNSTKCLLQSDFEGSGYNLVNKTPASNSQTDQNTGTNDVLPSAPLQDHPSGPNSRLRRKKSCPAVCQTSKWYVIILGMITILYNFLLFLITDKWPILKRYTILSK